LKSQSSKLRSLIDSPAVARETKRFLQILTNSKTVLHEILIYSVASSKGVEWPAKRCYVGRVAVGVQEQTEDILVPPLLRNCLTLMTFPLPSHYLPSRTVLLAIVFTV